MPMEFDAFISYASADKTAADAACAVLEAAGIRCWVAPRDISPGREYAAAIIDAIDRCRVMVLIFSSNANDSPQVRREIERAASKGVAIMPVRIEKVVPTKSMEYFLGDIHWLDAMTPPIENHLQQLAVSIKALLNANAAVGTPSYRAAQLLGGADRFDPKYSARKSWRLPAIAGVVFIALLFGGAWVYQNRASKPLVDSKTSEPKPEPKKAEALVPELIPFITDRARATIRNAYLPANDHKALAISLLQIGFTSGQADDDAAKAGALDNCRQATDATGRKDIRCDLYALGNTVVYTGSHPPLPPEPWFVPNASVERPFDAMNVPLVGDRDKPRLAKDMETPSKTKALAVSPAGSWSFTTGSNTEEAIRRALEWCGRYGAPCMIVAVDDRFVVAIPTTMKVTGFFQANTNALVLPELRSDVARRLRNITTGWTAVAVGAGGAPGLALGALSEQAAIDGALGDCGTRDRNCRVIAIGPFLVEPTPASTPPTTGNASQTPSARSNVASAPAPTPPPTGNAAQSPSTSLPRGWIGVRIQSVTEEIAESLNIKPPRGVLVAGVDENGPAKAGGIQVGDVLVKFDGQDIKEARDLPLMVTGTTIGQQVEISLIRRGKEETHTVSIGRTNGSE
jgi:hypothetical protein